MENINTKKITHDDIKEYLYKYLKHERKVFKESCRIFVDSYNKTKSNNYIIKYRKDLFRMKRWNTRNLDMEILSKFFKDKVISNYAYYDKHFLTNFFKKAMQKNFGSFEWLDDNNTPMYNLEMLLNNIIATKKLLNEFDKGVIFQRKNDKDTYKKSIKNIDNLTELKRKKLIKYAVLENRQELLSYIKHENIITSLSVEDELNHLDNISLMSKEKIIRSFYYYLFKLLKDDDSIKKDLNKNKNIDKFFRECLEYYLDKDCEFQDYYNTDRFDYDNLKRIRKTKNKQTFNFHNTRFTYYK